LIEQLAADAGVAANVGGLAIWIGCGLHRGEVVALGELGLHELVEDAFGFFLGDRAGGFGSGVQCAAAPAVGEGDDVAVVLRFDGGVVDFASIGHSKVHPPGCFWDGRKAPG